MSRFATALLLLAACSAPSAPLPLKARGVSESESNSNTVVPAAIADLDFVFTPAFTSYQFQEGRNVPNVTASERDGDPFGAYFSPLGAGAFRLQASSDATRPALTTFSGRTALSFDRADGDGLEVINATPGIDVYHQNPSWTLVLGWSTRAASVRQDLIDTTSFESRSSGFSVGLTADDRLRFFMTRSVPGSLVYDVTSEAAVSPSHGRVCTVIQVDREKGGRIAARFEHETEPSAWETFAQLAAPGVLPALGMTIGCNLNGGNCLDGTIDLVELHTRVLSEDEISAICGWRPERTSANQNVAVDRGWFSGLYAWYSPRQQSTLFLDPECANPLGRFGQSIGCIGSAQDPAHRFGRQCKQSEGAARPIFRGPNGAEFGGPLDGVQDWCDFENLEPRGGAQTFIVAMRCRDGTDGCRPFRGAGQYLAWTAPEYAGNEDGVAYFILHTGDGSSHTEKTPFAIEGGRNIIEIARQGGDWMLSSSGEHTRTVFDPNAWNPLSFSSATERTWEADLYLWDLLIFNGALSADQIATIRRDLQSIYGEYHQLRAFAPEPEERAIARGVLATQGAVTYDFWMRCSGHPQPGRAILGRDFGGAIATAQTPGALAFIAGSATQFCSSSDAEIIPNRWQRFTVTYDQFVPCEGLSIEACNHARTQLFVDSVLDDFELCSSTGALALSPDARNFEIHAPNGGAGCELANIAVYGEALGEADLQSIQVDTDRRTAAFNAALLAWWPVQLSDTPERIADRSGNGHDLELIAVDADDLHVQRTP